MNQNQHKFYLITIAIFVAIGLFVTATFVSTYYSVVSIEVTGSSRAYFVLSYDSTNATIPFSRNVTVDVLPHVDVTIAAYLNSSVTLSSWRVSGAQVVGTGNDTVIIMTGQGGSTVKVTAVLETGT